MTKTTNALAAIKTAFAAMHDDADSAAFFKKYESVKHLNKRELLILTDEAHRAAYPGCGSVLTPRATRATKTTIVRWLAAAVARLG